MKSFWFLIGAGTALAAFLCCVEIGAIASLLVWGIPQVPVPMLIFAYAVRGFTIVCVVAIVGILIYGCLLEAQRWENEP